jgi:hypothetical protein
MRRTLLALLLIGVPILPAPATALSRQPRHPIHVIRFERPAGFSIPDALVGVGAAGLVIGLTALLATRRSHNQTPFRR